METNTQTCFNSAQLHLLQLFSRVKSDEELEEIQQLITEYYSKKVEDGMSQLWQSGQWDNAKNTAILSQHLRTPYAG